MKCEWCDNEAHHKIEKRPASAMFMYACDEHKHIAHTIAFHEKNRPIRKRMKK